MRKRILVTPLGLALIVAFAAFALVGASIARADSVGPINFESPYALGDIGGQQGWMKTGAFDFAVANVNDFAAASAYGFGAQALRLSDSVTSGSFGDQTFSPGIASAAGEYPAQSHFDATFQIGTALAGVQSGMHMSVSPDNGSGGRMSYLRFEDQADGVHVLFDDVTDSGPFYTVATFNETDIATLDRSSAHTIRFSIDFKTGRANDVVKIYVDSVLKITGTTWEDYYRYDNENQGAGLVPVISKLLFRESGTANSADAGNGFLVDSVSLASTPCAPTGLVRDGIDLTARQIGGSVTGTIDASGCNIGVYYGPGTTGSVTNANISGANYYGVVVNAAAVDVTNTTIHDIGENPLNGSQHGVGVLYTTINQAGASTGSAATGTLSGNTITRYQKNGVVVSGSGAAVTVRSNTVTGEGEISYIAQNGIQISFGATARVFGNIVSLNNYTPPKVTACGLLIYKAGGVSASTKAGISYIKAENAITGNETDICNFGKGGGFSPTT